MGLPHLNMKMEGTVSRACSCSTDLVALPTSSQIGGKTMKMFRRWRNTRSTLEFVGIASILGPLFMMHHANIIITSKSPQTPSDGNLQTRSGHEDQASSGL